MAEACKETAIYQPIYWRQMGNFSLKLVEMEKIPERKEWEELKLTGSISGQAAVKSACKSPHNECNLPEQCWGSRTQQVALSWVFTALDVPRGVQTLTSRVWLPVGVPTAALGTKSKP